MAVQITLTDDQVKSVLTQDGTVPALQAQVTQLQADKATLQSQITAANASVATLTSDKAALQAKIDAAKAAAQKDKDADNASVAGQGVLDALA